MCGRGNTPRNATLHLDQSPCSTATIANIAFIKVGLYYVSNTATGDSHKEHEADSVVHSLLSVHRAGSPLGQRKGSDTIHRMRSPE